MIWRRDVSPALAGLVMVFALSACPVTAPASCPEVLPDPPPRLTCEEAIGAARGALAATPGVMSLDFAYQACPENARCRYADGDAGNVTAETADGEQLVVFVFVDENGIVSAEPPRAAETSEAEPAD